MSAGRELQMCPKTKYEVFPRISESVCLGILFLKLHVVLPKLIIPTHTSLHSILYLASYCSMRNKSFQTVIIVTLGFILLL